MGIHRSGRGIARRIMGARDRWELGERRKVVVVTMPKRVGVSSGFEEIVGIALHTAFLAGVDGIGQEGIERLTKQPLQIKGGCIDLPERPGLGIELDREQLMKAHKIYMDNCLGARDDAIGMQYLIPGWKFDPKRPCLVR